MKTFLLGLIFLSFNLFTFSQVVIKEKVELNARKPGSGTVFNGCSYNYYSEAQVELRFVPDSITSGDTTHIQAWIVGPGYEYEFNDNNYYLVQRTIDINPQYGNIISEMPSGDFVFVLSGNVPDSIKEINVDFDDYVAACVIGSKIIRSDTIKAKDIRGMLKPTESVSTIKNITGGCVNCGPYPSGLFRYYGSGSIMINKEKLLAYFDKDTLSPGDTVNIIVKEIDANGNEISYPDTTHFEAGILQGCGLGNLLDANGNKGEFFSNIQEPIRFVVNDSVDVDSANMVFKFGAPLINESLLPKIVKAQQKFMANDKYNIAANTHLTKGKKVTLITGSNTCTINEYSSALTCTESEALVRGARLEIILPKQGGNNETITGEPKMPTVICQAQLQNYNGGQVTLNWEYKVDYHLQTRSGTYTYIGSTTGSGSNITIWNVPFDNIFRGGKVTLTLKAITDAGKTYPAMVSPNSIVGENPSPSDARAGVDLSLQVLMYKESRFRQFDSKGYPLYGPGKNGGYGICQPDNPVANEQELWNWKDNRDKGSQILAKKAALAAGYAVRIRNGRTWQKDASDRWQANDPVPFGWYGEISPTGKYIRQIPYPNARDLQQGEELQKETFQRNNGGHYWRWMPDIKGNSESLGHWISEPTNSYGDDWWNIYQNVINGNPPGDWN